LKTVLEVWDPTWKLSKSSVPGAMKNSVHMKRESSEKRITMLLASRSESKCATVHSMLMNGSTRMSANTIEDTLSEDLNFHERCSSTTELLNEKVQLAVYSDTQS